MIGELYLDREWSATEIAADLDTTVHQVLRTLHEHDIPVCKGGAPHKRDGDRALRRLTALYQDPDVTALLRQHRIPERPVAGTITQRFPTPTPITRSFLTTAYGEIGLATAHIEQLTGQAAERILQLLHDRNIPGRPSGSQSPWLRRQRDL